MKLIRSMRMNLSIDLKKKNPAKITWILVDSNKNKITRVHANWLNLNLSD